MLKNYSNNIFLKYQALKALILQLMMLKLNGLNVPLKTPMSTPKIASTSLIHPDIVELTTCLWGWTKLKRSCHSSEVVHFSDILRYSFKTATTHKLLSSSKEWKTTEGGNFSFFHALWSFWKRKVKLLGVFTMNLMFRDHTFMTSSRWGEGGLVKNGKNSDGSWWLQGGGDSQKLDVPNYN